MWEKEERKHNYNLAKKIVGDLESIVSKINRKDCPGWLLDRLDSAQYTALCLQQELERVMRERGDLRI